MYVHTEDKLQQQLIINTIYMALILAFFQGGYSSFLAITDSGKDQEKK